MFLANLEDESFAGGEKFYQPLKDFMKEKSQEETRKNTLWCL